MNELIDRILDLPKQHKIGLLAAVIAAILLLDYLFLYSPRSDQIWRLGEEIENARSERDKKKRLAANLPKLQAQLKELDGMLKEAVATLPDKKEIPDLLSSISGRAREAGLDVLIFRPKGESVLEFYAEIPVDVVVRGGFHSVVTFFDEVGRLKRLVNIQNIEIKASPQKKEKATVETSALATTFRFLDEAERARIAAGREAKAKKK